MNNPKPLLLLLFFLTSCFTASSQIETGYLISKKFKGFGGTAMLNFSFPLSNEADYLSIEGGASYYTNSESPVLMVPLLVGYRYTLNRSGLGFYFEPNVGYSLGATEVEKEDENGNFIYDVNAGGWVYLKSKGVTTGFNLGYLFPKGEQGLFRGVQWNLCFRYSRTFSELGSNTFSLRLTHAFSFGSRD